MAEFLLDFRRPDADGGLSPASGSVVFTPTRRRVEGDHVVLPVGFRAKLSDGVVTVELAPTDRSWVWHVSEELIGLRRETYLVAVAEDSASFWDLPRVDPDTLDPEPEPEAAWWGAVDEMIIGAEVDGDDLMLARQNGDMFNAGRVKGDKGDKGDQGDQGDDGATIVDDATAQAAKGYRDEAQTARTDAETAATSSADSAGDAKADADRAETEADRAKAEREATEALGITVDNSVGTRVFVGGTMVYGDTGWRDILELVDQEVLTPEGISVPRIHIRRENNLVTCSIRLAIAPELGGTRRTLNKNFLTDIPVGFRQQPVSYGVLVGGPLLRSSSTVSEDVNIILTNLSGNSHLGVQGTSGDWVSSADGHSRDAVAYTVSWNTNQSWPSTLPGIPT